MSELILLGGLALIAFGAISRKLERSPLTAPMIFVLLGFAAGPAGLGLIEQKHEPIIHVLAEITLILVLFTDAARIDLRRLRIEHDLPVRLLAVGMPLTIIAGAGLAILMFPEFGLFEAAVLAAILAPTDAALGQAVVSNENVPVRIRQALNVESGLNDGIALPVILILLFAGCATHGVAAQGAEYWIKFTFLQVTLGPLVGAIVGYGGGKLVDWSTRTGKMTHGFRDLAVVALALVAFSGAELVGGNGFIAAFVGGLFIGTSTRGTCSGLFEFSESEGQLLTIGTFTIFGAIMAPEAVHHADFKMVLYGVASLTIIRILPVAFGLIGKRLHSVTVLFLGWFGPRGLATILFALLVVERATLPHAETIVSTAIVTVLLSTFLHGLTAYPASNAFGKWSKNLEEEQKTVEEMPVRVPMRS